MEIQDQNEQWRIIIRATINQSLKLIVLRTYYHKLQCLKAFIQSLNFF